MFSCKNIFFPVGQGGFMYSRIENNGEKELDFIYDCGSDTGSIGKFLDKSIVEKKLINIIFKIYNANVKGLCAL